VRRSTVPLLLLCALSFFVGLGSGAITDADEAFYAQSAREMVESGDWITPHYNYEPRFQKPVLYYWLTAATYLATGPNEFAARLWSAMSGVGLVLVIAACGRRWFDEDIGLLAGAIAATTFGYFTMARMALPDLPLTFFITLSIYAALVAMLDREPYPRKFLLLSAAAAALAFLTKGPVGIVIPALVVVPIVLLERRSVNLELTDFVLALLLLLALALPWYVVMWMRHGTAYLEGFFVGDNYERFATARFNDPRPWWFYLPVLAGGLLPWTPLVIVWFAPIWQFLSRRRDIASLDIRLLMWAVLPLLFYSLSVGKQPRYLLPVLPPVALLLAGSIVERTREWRSLDGVRVRPRPNRAVVLGCALSGAFLVAVATLLYRARPLFIDVSDAVALTAVGVIGLVGATVVIVSFTSGWRGAPLCLAAASAITFAVLPYGVLARPHDSAVWHLAQAVAAENDHRRPVGTYHVFVRNLIFYTGVRQADLLDDSHLEAFATDNPGALVVLPAADLERLERAGSLRFERLRLLRYFDEGQFKLGTLVQPRAEEVLTTIVLARVFRG
jgi:4-amino-4-deoxy-L-arabinose transferase-like glycosyltransferase